MNLDPISLYILDNTGSIRVWAIEVKNWNIVISHGQLGGSIQEHTEEVLEGKAGRSRKDQILLRVASDVSKKRDQGYTNKIADAQNRPTNVLKMKKPMLAKKLDDINLNQLINKTIYIQYKYDGFRCLVHCKNGEKIAYTRNGKMLTSIDHILCKLEVPEGVTLDGELYCHGETLQSISSWVKRKQPNTMRVEYHIYDVMIDKPYSERLAFLLEASESIAGRVVPTRLESRCSVEELSEVLSVGLTEARALGYEGLIARWSDRHYEDGKRSFGLVKIKHWDDEEFIVVDVNRSADNWGILVCKVGDTTFTVSAPGTVEKKKEILLNKQNYIGRKVKVEFANKTVDGIPFHPVAVCFI